MSVSALLRSRFSTSTIPSRNQQERSEVVVEVDVDEVKVVAVDAVEAMATSNHEVTEQSEATEEASEVVVAAPTPHQQPSPTIPHTLPSAVKATAIRSTQCHRHVKVCSKQQTRTVRKEDTD